MQYDDSLFHPLVTNLLRMREESQWQFPTRSSIQKLFDLEYEGLKTYYNFIAQWTN
jgi:hypothetical protein